MKHLRVVMIDPDLAGAYCGRLFAGTGADVLFAEPLGGSGLRRKPPFITTDDGHTVSALWEYVAAGTRSVVVAGDSEMQELFTWADVVVSSCNGDADGALALRERIRATNPAAVHVVTSGYGLTGPYRDWRRSELTEWAAGGHMYLTGEPDREPLQGGGPWISYLTGATAAIGAQAAVLHAVRTGEGQLVDVGAFEAAASLHQWTLTMYTHTGAVKRRWGNRFAESFHPIALYACTDGWISIVAPSYQQFEALCLLVDGAELLIDPEFQATAVRFDRAAEIDPFITRWTSVRSCRDAVEQLQAAGVPASELKTISDVIAEPQLSERDFWMNADRLHEGARLPRVPFRTDAGEVTMRHAPLWGEHTEEAMREVRLGASRPALPMIDLSQLRMTEFSIAWAGPLAGRWLGDLGVDVVIVEHPASRGVVQRTDPDDDWEWGKLPAPYLRSPVFPRAAPGERWWNRMGIFNKMNRSKRSLCLSAKEGAGPDVLRGILAKSDIVLNNYSPRGARSLGVDAAGVDAACQGAAGVGAAGVGAVTVSLTGYGETGPLSAFLSYGPVLQAHGGFDEATGYDGAGPTRLGLAFPDCVGGLHGVFATITALWERELYGRAVHVDLSQFEALLSIAGEMVLSTSVTGRDPVRHGNRSDACSPQNVYRCLGEDEWVAISAVDDDQWRALGGAIGGPLVGLFDAQQPARRKAAAEIDDAISRWTAERTPIEAATLLQSAGVAAFPVMTNQAIVEDPHMRSRGFIATWDQTDVGPMEFPGFPVHFEILRPRLTTCPGLGADNRAVLTEWLNMDEGEIAALTEQGVLADHPPFPTSQ